MSYFVGLCCYELYENQDEDTYCSNQAKAGMNPKTLQYLMGHSDIGVTMNVYTHLGLEDAEEELRKMEDFRRAQEAIEKKEEKPITQKAFKVI